jgi:hypothetical protein
MCRTELTDEEQQVEEQQVEEQQVEEQIETWMINPQTKRRIKVGGKTWTFLRENGIL